ncbi:MAG: hypothetical protein N2255_05860, partial [Kiritimatiellae bacterium]|nr:hypothetical protein [Kiritimatiellia bacterium]
MTRRIRDRWVASVERIRRHGAGTVSLCVLLLFSAGCASTPRTTSSAPGKSVVFDLGPLATRDQTLTG